MGKNKERFIEETEKKVNNGFICPDCGKVNHYEMESNLTDGQESEWLAGFRLCNCGYYGQPKILEQLNYCKECDIHFVEQPECPKCGTEPMKKCKNCGKINKFLELNKGLCDECVKDWKVDLDVKGKRKFLVYMAGKISVNDWRHDILGERKLRNSDYWKTDSLHTHKTTLKINNEVDYCGPFFVSCDHGCYHGESTHGVVRDNGYDCSGSSPVTEKTLFNGCLKQIEKADYVFCWIDDLTAYGTLFELGIAYEKNKKIFIGIDKKLEPKDSGKCNCGTEGIGKGCCHSGSMKNPDELWFIKQSSFSTNYYSSPIEAWDNFLNILNPELKKEKEEFVKTLNPLEQEDFLELKDRQPMSKTITYFKRNREITKQLKELYNNKCQICDFTFKKDNGENYSETHHVIPLGENGDDDIKNLIVVCPNCHKKLHYAKKEKYDIKYKAEHYNLMINKK